MRTTCEMCGATPAALVKSRWHLGMIVYGRTTGTEAVLCRAHAGSVVGRDLAKTLLLGWWGTFSFFINLFVVPMQIGALAKARAIGRDDKASLPAPAAESRVA